MSILANDLYDKISDVVDPQWLYDNDWSYVREDNKTTKTNDRMFKVIALPIDYNKNNIELNGKVTFIATYDIRHKQFKIKTLENKTAIGKRLGIYFNPIVIDSPTQFDIIAALAVDNIVENFDVYGKFFKTIG